MQSLMIVLMGLAGMTFGWFVYSKFIATKIYQLDPNFVTPANEFNDGVDFVPTNKYVLWGHHFTSVAGAAPIVGPAIAVYWGWVPAVLWVIGSVVLSWVAPGNSHPLLQLIEEISAGILSPIRKFLPPMGGLDFTPIIGLLVLNLINTSFIQIIRSLL